MKLELRIQSSNPVLRFWGNTCGRIADVFLAQSLKYGDLYDLEPYLETLENLENIDDTIVWKEDE